MSSDSAPAERGQWKSRIGFILAASGSAIGLGNIVFFSANAYKFGAGAFYLPYIIALFAVGIPVMILEFGLGHHTGRAFPEAMFRTCGRKGEFLGWWAVVNASMITMYYITILGWVVGMWVGALGDLWTPSVAVTAFGMAEGALPNPVAYFFDMISSWGTAGGVALVWVLNVVICLKGARGIESAVRFIVPAMWILMAALIVRGVTLPEGIHGVYLLFTPDFSVMSDPEVWQGAFSQIFFTLSLGFGIMTAYASYLPKDSDQVNNGLMVSFMNCGFEFVAGLAVFTLLFAFAVAPKASTISMMFFVVPGGIAKFPAGVAAFGVLFFTLLLIAGLSSSISLVEALVSALIDKFEVPRRRAVLLFSAIGLFGSILFALPTVIDKGLASDGTLGLTLLDLVDHWAFSYGLLIVGLGECLLLGWVYGVDKIRDTINASSARPLPASFDVLVKWVIPGAVGLLLVWAIYKEVSGGFYGHDFEVGELTALPYLAFGTWLVLTFGVSFAFTRLGTYGAEAAPESS